MTVKARVSGVSTGRRRGVEGSQRELPPGMELATLRGTRGQREWPDHLNCVTNLFDAGGVRLGLV
eukprot:2843242-Pyramimonas_sp.AAC.1